MENKLLDPKETEEKVISSLKEYGKPVSAGWIAWKLDIQWATAKSLLLTMALNGKIRAIDTSKGYFFSLNN